MSLLTKLAAGAIAVLGVRALTRTDATPKQARKAAATPPEQQAEPQKAPAARKSRKSPQGKRRKTPQGKRTQTA